MLVPYWYFSTGRNLKGKIAFTDKFNVYIYEFSSNHLKKLITYNPKIWYFSLAWSPSEPLIAIENQPLTGSPGICRNGFNRIFIVNENTGNIILNLQYPGKDCHEPIWSPDGSMLAFIAYNPLSSKKEFPLLVIYNIKSGETRTIKIPRLEGFHQKLTWLKNSLSGTTLYLAQKRKYVSPTHYDLIKLEFLSCNFDSPYTLSIVKELCSSQNRISVISLHGMNKIAYGNSGLHYGFLDEELKSFRFKKWRPISDISWVYDIFDKNRILFSTEHETDYLVFASVNYPLYCFNPNSGYYYQLKIPKQVVYFTWKY
jgi:hypothetical protein